LQIFDPKIIAVTMEMWYIIDSLQSFTENIPVHYEWGFVVPEESWLFSRVVAGKALNILLMKKFLIQ